MHEALCRFNSSAAPMSRFVFAVRCAILSPMHAIWFRAEYRPSPSGVLWRSLPHPAKSESLNLLSLFVSLCRAGSRVIPGRFLRCYRALEPRNARRMCNGSLNDHDCANNFPSTRLGLKGKYCSQSVQAMSLRRFSQRTGSTNSAGGRGASAAGPETLREAGLGRRA